MSNKWNEIINQSSFSWTLNTEKLLQSGNITSYTLHQCIFNSTPEQHNNLLFFLSNTLKLTKGISIAEFGSGNSSILFWLKEVHNADVYGFDISKSLVSLSKKITPGNYYTISADIDRLPIHDKQVDWCISNSSFQYLENEQYARLVIQEMLRISNRGILITDIKNAEYAEQFKDLQACRQNITRKELDIKYKDTPLLFFSKSFFDYLRTEYNISVYNMPDYPDCELGSFAVLIEIPS